MNQPKRTTMIYRPRFSSGQETPPQTLADQEEAIAAHLAELGLDVSIGTAEPDDDHSSRRAMERDIADGRIERVVDIDEDKPT